MRTRSPICNVATSSMVRQTELVFLTRAGTEVGVASTKAFTTQLVALFLLALTLAKLRGRLSETTRRARTCDALRHLPAAMQARARARAAAHRVGARRSRASSTRCSSAAGCTTRSRSKAR